MTDTNDSKLTFVPKTIKINIKSVWRSFDTKTNNTDLLYPALSDDGLLILTPKQAAQLMQELVNYFVANTSEEI